MTIHCAARTGFTAGSHGFEPVYCATSIGLREHIGADGRGHPFCGALGHALNVVARFGNPQPEACFTCGDTGAIVDGRYVLVDFSGSLRVVCDECFARGDEPDDEPPEWANREGDPTLNGAFR
jgi:hypothetical protein